MPLILSQTTRDESTSTYADNDIGYSCGPYIVGEIFLEESISLIFIDDCSDNILIIGL